MIESYMINNSSTKFLREGVVYFCFHEFLEGKSQSDNLLYREYIADAKT